MQHRRRKIAETMAAGFGTEEIAALFNLSKSRISQLRRELKTSWGEFQRERPRGLTIICAAAR
jgi:predicted house-cleaning noncanonical NTP pyrophosphatase (MazG superfamily)